MCSRVIVWVGFLCVAGSLSGVYPCVSLCLFSRELS